MRESLMNLVDRPNIDGEDKCPINRDAQLKI